MSSEELAIILHVDEGTSLNLKNDQVVLVASLGGNLMESDAVYPGHSTIFDCNLVWQCDKKAVKRMKMENYPVKVEVYTVKAGDDDRHKRQLVGHLLFPVRNIPLLPPAKAILAKSKWYKLIGLSPEWRSQKPELLLSIMITDQEFFLKTKDALMEPSRSEESILVDLNPEFDILTSQQGLFIRLLKDEGLLQVGNVDTDCDVFLAKVQLKQAKFIENLLANTELLDEDLQLKYMFPQNENPFNCEMVKRPDGSYGLQEIIAINIRTSLKALQMYFNKIFYISVQIWYKDAVIGNARLSLENLLTIDTLQEFLRVHHDNDNTYEVDTSCPIFGASDLSPFQNKPLLEYGLSLTYLSTNKLAVHEILERRREAERLERGGIDYAAAGDQVFDQSKLELPPTNLDDIQSLSVSKLPLKVNKSEIIGLDERKPEPEPVQSDPVLVQKKKEDNDDDIEVVKDDMDEKRDEDSGDDANIPHTFAYNLVVQSIKFTNRVENGIWQLSFYHPKADTPFTIVNLELSNIQDQTVDFSELELQLYFSAPIDEVESIVASDNAIFNVSGPRGSRGKAELNNQTLLAANKEKKTGIVMLENQHGEKMAMATVSVYLENMGINHNSQIKKSIVLEPVSTKAYIDEGLTYKFVEDLERWKKEQEENFMVELKRKEIQHLAKLSAEWRRRKTKYEKELSDKLEKCQVLTETLEEAQSTLKEKGLEQMQQEQLLHQAKVDLEQCYNNQLGQIKEKCRRMEDDFRRKVSDEQLRYKELEITMESLAKANVQLKDQIAELEERNVELKSNVFPKEQLLTLCQDMRQLNEKYQNTLKSKMFYKEQWAKMIREVHLLKSTAVQKYKDEVMEKKFFGIDHWLENEKFELNSDLSELDFIKRSFECD